MDFNEIFLHLNLFHQSKKQGVSVWQYPQFLFLIMGIMTIVAILTSYGIGIRYVAEPEIVVLVVLVLSALLMLVTFTITQSFERLIEANRMKSEFVSIVSHQIRSPLSNLRWSLELLMSGRLGPIEAAQLEYFRILKESSNRMRDLTKDLLTVSRIDQGRLPLNPKAFSIPDLVKGLVSEFIPLATASNVKIEVVVDNNLPSVFADQQKVGLVVENFLDNSIRYIEEKGKVKMKITKEKNCIRFEISDNGVGIPKDDQKYMFRRFFRSSNVLKRQTQGTGLGLYIAKSIIERSKGKIGFQSKENQGSTFWFTLPIA
ncbi:sensor histidine kinase [Patescibacteria group bacterium]